MSKQHYVFSRMASNMHYDEYASAPDAGSLPSLIRSVLIKGGAGLANKNLITPVGVMTVIDDEELESLKKNPVFLKHEKGGFISVQKKAYDVEKVVADMGNAQDPSAPLSPSDFVDTRQPVPMGLRQAA